jgi:hypothetical protein
MLHPFLAMHCPFLATLHPFPATLRPFLATLRPFPATLRPFPATLRPFPATLRPFVATRRPLLPMLRPFLAMLHAFAATRCEGEDASHEESRGHPALLWMGDPSRQRGSAGGSSQERASTRSFDAGMPREPLEAPNAGGPKECPKICVICPEWKVSR